MKRLKIIPILLGLILAPCFMLAETFTGKLELKETKKKAIYTLTIKEEKIPLAIGKKKKDLIDQIAKKVNQEISLEGKLKEKEGKKKIVVASIISKQGE